MKTLGWFFEEGSGAPQYIEQVVAIHDLDIDHPKEIVTDPDDPAPFQHIPTDLEEK